MATKTTQARKPVTKRAQPKAKAPQPNPTTEPEPDQAAVELAEPPKQGRVSKADAEFIDPDPGYSEEQVAHMKEYYGLDS